MYPDPYRAPSPPPKPKDDVEIIAEMIRLGQHAKSKEQVIETVARYFGYKALFK